MDISKRPYIHNLKLENVFTFFFGSVYIKVTGISSSRNAMQAMEI